MKKSELDSILNRARLPEVPEESRELFPRRIVVRLQNNAVQSPQVRKFLPRLAWPFGLAAGVIIAFAIGHWSGRMEPKNLAASDSLADLKLIRETMAMFPNRVRAIVRDERGMNLVLSDQENVPASTPIYVRICDGEHCSSLVTFSGQEIQIGEQKLTVLSQPDGGIILTGNQFGKHLKIEAKNLGAVTM
jgi:hypothetical protein